MKLSFRLGSIPVHVHASFLFTAVIFGMGGGSAKDPRPLLIWVGAVFLGVLAHELGHALMGIAFGLSPQIDLVGLGGLTSWSSSKAELGRARRIAISFAGPLVGIVLGTMALLTLKYRPPASFWPLEFLDDAWQINLFWGVLNLLPIMPLDGGNISFVIMDKLTLGRGERPARILSVATAAVMVVLGLYARQPFAALMAGMFGFQNFQALRFVRARDADEPLRKEVARGFDAVARGEGNAAVRSALSVLDSATVPELRADAIRLLAFGHLLEGAWGPLMQLMQSPASSAIGDDELMKFERAASELGRPDEAQQIAAVRARRTAFSGA